MSDNSNSTGSSGSSTNSWTLLSPEEAAGDSVGPVDDGTESLGDAPSLSEDMAAGAAMEFKPSGIPVERALSEEGHQVCQETAPESGEGPIPSNPSPPSPPPAEVDTESQAPVIHDIVTSSPSDNEHMSDVPFVSSIDFLVPQDISATAAADELQGTLLDTHPTERPIADEPESDARVEPVEVPQVDIPAETITASEAPSFIEAESPADEDLVPETVGPVEEDVKMQDEEEEESPTSFDIDFPSSHGDGLRKRAGQSDAPKSEEEEEEEEEDAQFRLAERQQDKAWWSVNKCIAAGLILLFLGSLFLSGDLDSSGELDDEQSQDLPSNHSQEMVALLDKLTQENQHITLLEAKLQSQKKVLDAAVALSIDSQEKADLEKENVQLREELSSLPNLKEELESLRVMVTELSHLAADSESRTKPTPSIPTPAKPERKMKEELQKQKVLLEESKKRLQGMKKDGGHRRPVRDNLEEIQRKLSEQVEHWGKRRAQKHKMKGGEKEDKDGGKRAKEGRKEKEWKMDKDGRKEEWKSPKHISHKESWRKNQDEWETKKHERRQDREERRKEKPWHKTSKHHSHKPHRTHAGDFWLEQEQKLKRNIRPRPSCTSVEDCAAKEGLYPVELPEFDELLDGYLSKLEGTPPHSKDAVRRLASDFFADGVFMHDRVLFADFAEDVADILEDMVDVVEDGRRRGDDSLEEEMEEFEREALWKFAATF
ncbi:pre-B-cell leukemia transcription factor-interacting protein 1 [Nerophis lumbriciformis]|uniref:pre-B-cell leukemia transcription factor-interacting protein 1 n=1 Tax=Nerophis lumbriciformis TaxID=546530 RepID=UPI002ADF82D2|nr:pre-B-cell leukemia transcription factor-interacting protein 1 [Nerophis lumbriciformis]XP_061787430.1 pre-B-cell leukemia transcription factor-interacting protein 1 [Nerophis lumbriciformis]XP_061787431.1 pre-B-cell leukemia transcription factor-interacting protein 1 [Nerophis lumbriciformis]XP_061787432.1 pre-B-cell leukemia transcription factor-interacting protein 1 [Nerophis lumbriciformis]